MGRKINIFLRVISLLNQNTIYELGGSNDQHSVNIDGDFISNYSSRGPTKAKIMKPDVVAPGANIISCNANTFYLPQKVWEKPKEDYSTKSGTSMSAPIVTGALALLLEKEPFQNPNDIKLRLRSSCEDLGFKKNQQGWGLVNIDKLLD